MPEATLSEAELIERANCVYWKSLLALFAVAFAIIIFFLAYLFADWWSSSCDCNFFLNWFQRICGRDDCGGSPSIFIITITAGALGAVFSNITRLYQIDQVSELFAQKIIAAKLHHMALYAVVPAVVGAVAAAVMYLIFAAKFIQGTPFPAFSCTPGVVCDSIDGLINSWGPDKAEDYAKVIFWGFVVGFSERLIPDMLGQYSRLIEQKASEAAKPGTQGANLTPAEAKALADAKRAAETAKTAADQAATAAKDARSKADRNGSTAEEQATALSAEALAADLVRKAGDLQAAYEKLRR